MGHFYEVRLSNSRVDLPDGMVEKIVDGVKVKLSEGKLSGAVDSIKKLF